MVKVANTDNLLEKIDGSDGYFVGQMSEVEVNTLAEMIREQYLSRVLSFSAEYSNVLSQYPMSQYHTLAENLPHKELWPKKARILGQNAVKHIKSLPFFKLISEKLNIVAVTGEDGSGWEEIYWRIVRPGSSDIGDLHADKWFWDLGHGDVEPGMRRLKIWIAIHTVPGKSGLRLLPGSHLKQDWNYHGERDESGKSKPKLDENINPANIHNVTTESGHFIVFHDELVHGGMPNLSAETRVSLEATLLVKDN